eukprot:6854329-Pyramimonas_sp.AAC.1
MRGLPWLPVPAHWDWTLKPGRSHPRRRRARIRQSTPGREWPEGPLQKSRRAAHGLGADARAPGAQGRCWGRRRERA